MFCTHVLFRVGHELPQFVSNHPIRQVLLSAAHLDLTGAEQNLRLAKCFHRQCLKTILLHDDVQDDTGLNRELWRLSVPQNHEPRIYSKTGEELDWKLSSRTVVNGYIDDHGLNAFRGEVRLFEFQIRSCTSRILHPQLGLASHRTESQDQSHISGAFGC